MGKKKIIKFWIVVIIGFLSLIVLNLSFFTRWHTENGLSPDFNEWIEQSKQQYNSSNHYVTCLFGKTCNGTFYLRIEMTEKANISELENLLDRYGKIRYIYGNSIEFETKDFYQINNFFKNPSIASIKLSAINPDKLNISEEKLISCKADNECISVQSGCCGCGQIVINKKNLDNFNSYRSLSCSAGLYGCVALACIEPSSNVPKCINNSCKFVNWTESPCESPMYNLCKAQVPKSEWDNGGQIYGNYDYPSCSQIVNLCEQNKTQEEILSLCESKIKFPEDYTKGEIIAYLDSNTTKEEIEDFFEELGLPIELKLTGYWYEISGGFDLLKINLSIEEKERLVKSETENFADYLNSSLTKNGFGTLKYSSYRVDQPHLAFGIYDNFIVAYFNGDVSLENSENFIKNYGNYDEKIYSLNVHNALPIGIIKVPKGEEKEWICKLREEKNLYNINFAT